MSQANLQRKRCLNPDSNIRKPPRWCVGLIPSAATIQSALSGNHVDHWYRLINRLMWIWRGVTPEILDVQARIVMSDAERTDPELYDSGRWLSRRQLDL